ncbi:hypothetical protein H4582DRAFT_2057972 [Lactarius indigo]|nr:hypothetical protein H4582DRAFT_2057972 [Lactarius indigo]
MNPIFLLLPPPLQWAAQFLLARPIGKQPEGYLSRQHKHWHRRSNKYIKFDSTKCNPGVGGLSVLSRAASIRRSWLGVVPQRTYDQPADESGDESPDVKSK